VRAGPGAPADWALLVRALANLGQLESAGRACAAGLERHSLSAELFYLYGLLLAEAGRHREAAAEFRRALYLDRGLAVAHLALGGALVRLGDPAGARRAFGNAHRLLEGTASDAAVPAADGARAGRLAEMARIQLELLREAAA
jgi:chemotaxis protein methyltransferase CheR